MFMYSWNIVFENFIIDNSVGIQQHHSLEFVAATMFALNHYWCCMVCFPYLWLESYLDLVAVFVSEEITGIHIYDREKQSLLFAENKHTINFWSCAATGR